VIRTCTGLEPEDNLTVRTTLPRVRSRDFDGYENARSHTEGRQTLVDAANDRTFGRTAPPAAAHTVGASTAAMRQFLACDFAQPSARHRTVRPGIAFPDPDSLSCPAMTMQANNAATSAGPTPLDRRLAPSMFGLTILFLLVTAGALHFGAEKAAVDDDHAELSTGWCVWGLALLYPVFWLETFAHWRTGSRRWRQNLSCCVLPPLRLGTRDHHDGRSIWLPAIG